MIGDGVDTTDIIALPQGQLALVLPTELQHISSDEPGTAGYLDAFRAQMNVRTRVIAFTHVTNTVGDALPAKQLCAMGYVGPPSASLQLAQQPQYLEIQPDDRNDQTKRGVPVHPLWRPTVDATLDEVEVDQEVESCKDDHGEAEEDPERSAIPHQRHRDAKGASRVC